MKKSAQGFTLIELLVVIAIIGILSSVVLASLNSARQKSRDARRAADLQQLKLALELYADVNNGAYPPGTSLAPLTTGGHIPAIPTDPGPGAPAYTYQALTSANAACASGTSCASYVLKATMEQAGHSVLAGDVDGTVASVACGTQGATETEYCIRP